MRLALSFLILSALLLTVTANAQQQAEDEKLQQRIDLAVEKGVAFLKEARGSGQEIPFVAWALIESGVPRTDPVIVAAHEESRRQACEYSGGTYRHSVLIIFLDRMGDPNDTLLIQSLATRLLDGQSNQGGWSYGSGDPSEAEATLLKEYVELISQKQPDAKAVKEKQTKVQQILTAQLRTLLSTPRPSAELTDNSNTQFAALALWIARRHGIPTDRALRMTELRFKGTQMRDGKWGYNGESDAAEESKTMGITCAGMIGIALGRATLTQIDLARSLAADGNVRNGLLALQRFMTWELPGDHKGRVYYALWSLERTAVIYDQKMIGGKDWYKWGATFLVDAQAENGSWSAEYGVPDTCFALLFLKRANPASDITKRFKGKFFTPLEKAK